MEPPEDTDMPGLFDCEMRSAFFALGFTSHTYPFASLAAWSQAKCSIINRSHVGLDRVQRRVSPVVKYRLKLSCSGRQRCQQKGGWEQGMSIKSDRWIKRMAAEGMIEPFEGEQVRSGSGGRIISYGTSKLRL